MTTTRIRFSGGQAQAVWSDDLVELVDALGSGRIRRVSDVEPTDGGQWQADMARVSGPVIGPFRTRGEALEAERVWLREHLGV